MTFTLSNAALPSPADWISLFVLRIPLEIFRSFCRGGKVNSSKVKHSPNKVLAVGAEGGLLEEARYEAMILHVVDVFLLQRALPATVPQQQLVVGHFLHFLFGHRRSFAGGSFSGFGYCGIRILVLSKYFIPTLCYFSLKFPPRPIYNSLLARSLSGCWEGIANGFNMHHHRLNWKCMEHRERRGREGKRRKKESEIAIRNDVHLF